MLPIAHAHVVQNAVNSPGEQDDRPTAGGHGIPPGSGAAAGPGKNPAGGNFGDTVLTTSIQVAANFSGQPYFGPPGCNRQSF